MITQISLEYHVLPDVKTMSMTVIRFWYEGIRKGLNRAAAERAKLKANRK